MPHHEDNNFSAAAEDHEFDALLFDMDGTIIDSTEAIVKYWRQLGKEIGVDPDEILKSSHGRRTIDVLSQWAPQLANWDFICKEEQSIPLQYGQHAVEIPGSRALLDALEAPSTPALWAIVTSGTRPLVLGWLDVMRLAHPKCLVTAEDVPRGKPDPACYRLGAKKLGFGEGGAKALVPERMLVLEDAPAGVKAGKAAGFRVVAVATTHAVEVLREAEADWIVRDLRSVVVSGFDAKKGAVGVQIRDALVV